MRKKPVIVSVLVVLFAAVAFGLYWFQPWKLLTSNLVVEAVPTTATTTVVASGTLITHEHKTSGKAELIRQADGTHQLVLRDLATSDGPDLHVWLTDASVLPGKAGWHVFDDGKYTEIGKLKGTHGTQVYEVPSTVDISTVKSVTIWCERFSVSFGAAPLTRA